MVVQLGWSKNHNRAKLAKCLKPMTKLADIATLDLAANHFIERLKAEGLILVPERVAEHGLSYYEKRRKLLAKKTVSPHEIVKYELLGATTVRTIKNMIKDGRIHATECYQETTGRWRIMTSAINRINQNQ